MNAVAIQVFFSLASSPWLSKQDIFYSYPDHQSRCGPPKKDLALPHQLSMKKMHHWFIHNVVFSAFLFPNDSVLHQVALK